MLLGIVLLLTLAVASCGGFSASATPTLILVEIYSSGDSCNIKDVVHPFPGSKNNNPWVHVHLFSPSDQLTFQSDDDAYTISLSGNSPLSNLADPFTVTHGNNLTSPVTNIAWACGLFQANEVSANPKLPCTYTFQVTDTRTSKACDPVIHVTR
jgi:hypothetical protein